MKKVTRRIDWITLSFMLIAIVVIMMLCDIKKSKGQTVVIPGGVST
jgi:hypothetical protein